MSGVFSFRPFKGNVIAVCLCMLAFAFAMEAKLAWYGPAGGPGSDIRAAKACPTKLLQIVARGTSTPKPVLHEVHSAFLGRCARLCLPAAKVLDRGAASIERPFILLPLSGSNLFFRPPPAI
jgi:hypothetical protein